MTSHVELIVPAVIPLQEETFGISTMLADDNVLQREFRRRETVYGVHHGSMYAELVPCFTHRQATPLGDGRIVQRACLA
jgi:hypothetical protein